MTSKPPALEKDFANVTTESDTLQQVKEVAASILQLGDKINGFDMETPLLGNLAELDSMAVVALLTALEEQYDFIIDDDEMSAEVFTSWGTLTRFVISKIEQ